MQKKHYLPNTDKSDTSAIKSIEPTGNQSSIELDLVNNEQIYSLFRSAVTKDVVQSLEDKQAKRRAATLAIVSIAFGIFAAVSTYLVNNYIDDRVQNLVTQKVGTQLALADVLYFSIAAQDLDEKSAFSDDDAERFIADISDLTKRFQNIEFSDQDSKERMRRGLSEAVAVVVTNFAAAERIDYIKRILTIAPEETLYSSSISHPITLVFGPYLASDSLGAQSWKNPEGINRESMEIFRLHIQQLREGNWPELYLVFEPIFRDLEGADTDSTAQLVSEIDSLSESDVESFKNIATAMLNGDLGSELSAERTKQSYERYRSHSVILDSLIDDSSESTEEISSFLEELERHLDLPSSE